MNQEQSNNHPLFGHKDIPHVFGQASLISVYTILRVLAQMRKELGIEVVFEYIDRYTRRIDRQNPRLSRVIDRALRMISVERIYREEVNG